MTRDQKRESKRASDRYTRNQLAARNLLKRIDDLLNADYGDAIREGGIKDSDADRIHDAVMILADVVRVLDETVSDALAGELGSRGSQESQDAE